MKPLVLLPCCFGKDEKGYEFHRCGDKYLRYAARHLDCLPLCLPSLGEEWLDLESLVSSVDGILLTGSPSNVDPKLYGAGKAPEGEQLDSHRDSTTLPLIRLAVQRGLPLLGICRGTQEINVALGGTLHHRVHQLEGKADHRAKKNVPLDDAYRKVHPVRLTSGGKLEQFPGLDSETSYSVNSLHGQGLDRLAPSLRVEALSPDDVIEAVSGHQSPGFLFGVQWHPEHWHMDDDPVSLAIIAEFRKAVVRHRDSRIPPRHSRQEPQAA